MSFWIFKCNPRRFDIDGRLRDPQPRTTYLVTRYCDRIRPGDTAFIWRTGPDGGIRAVMRVDSFPTEMGEVAEDAPYWADGRETGPALRVVGTFTHRFPCITRAALKGMPELKDLSVFHGFQQATNFEVSAAEGAVLWGLVNGR